jgi:hypothetical protein
MTQVCSHGLVAPRVVVAAVGRTMACLRSSIGVALLQTTMPTAQQPKRAVLLLTRIMGPEDMQQLLSGRSVRTDAAPSSSVGCFAAPRASTPNCRSRSGSCSVYSTCSCKLTNALIACRLQVLLTQTMQRKAEPPGCSDCRSAASSRKKLVRRSRYRARIRARVFATAQCSRGAADETCALSSAPR